MSGTEARPQSGVPRVASGFWTRAKTQSKVGFDKLWATADKLGDPVNKLSNKIGSEAFWPTTIDKESDKAARILKSFCKDGFYEEEVHKKPDGPQQKQRVLKRIPPGVIKNAKGLAVFTTMRTGLWVSGAGGSGILVGRKDDGTWSQPVGIMLHTAGLGFLVGVDIYDCVLVLNTPEALAAFSRWRCTVGGEISAVAGPAGVGGMLETEVHKRQAAVFTYLKSRGFYAGVQIDGTVVIERTDENERFYGERISAKDIIAGKAQSREPELRMLMATLKSAEGDARVDRSLLPTEPPPADMQVTADGQTFGVPDREDPDPYGVHALEKEGFVIREAGTRAPANDEQFSFQPSITSPIYDTFRKSHETSSRRGSWRSSTMSTSTSADREREKPRYVTSDSATQTDFPPVKFPSPRVLQVEARDEGRASPARSNKSPSRSGIGIQTVPEELAESKEVPATTRAITEETNLTNPVKSAEPTSAGQEQASGAVGVPHPESKLSGSPASASEDEDEVAEVHEAPVVHQVTQAMRPQVVSRAKVTTVAVPKRGPPPQLPPRHPARKRSFGPGSALDGSSAQASDSEIADTASVASFRSVGGPSSIRSGRASSFRDGEVTSPTSAVQSPAATPAEEKLNPIENTQPGQAEAKPISTSVTPIRSFKPMLVNNTRTTSPPNASKSVSPPPRFQPNVATNLRQKSSDSMNTTGRGSSSGNTVPRTVRQNSSGSGAVSALKSRFENKPPPINTTPSSVRPSSSHSNTNRSNSPLKQLSTYTTTKAEQEAGRVSPGIRTTSPQRERADTAGSLPGAFPNVDGAADQPPTNGIKRDVSPPEEPLRVGRSPIKEAPKLETLSNGVYKRQEKSKSKEPSPSPPISPRKGPSLIGMRSSLHPMRDDDSDIDSRSRSMSPVKGPTKVDMSDHDDFS